MTAIALSGFGSGGDGVDARRLSRRQVLVAAAGATAGCLVPAALPATSAASEEFPKAQPGGAGAMKVGLYSITFLGLWYRGNALTLDEVVRRAKQYG